MKVVLVEHRSLVHEALLRVVSELKPQWHVVNTTGCCNVPGWENVADQLELVFMVRRGLHDDMCAAPAQSYRPELSKRQTQVLALLLQGKPNKLISRELGLAQGTVKIHVAAILKKFGVANRTQAALVASRFRLKDESPLRATDKAADAPR